MTSITASSRPDPTRTAVGTWSGGRFMHFGEPLDDERFLALIAPDQAIPTVITADVYGAGEADTMLGPARGDRPGGGSRVRRSAWSAPSAMTSTPASARAPRASRASPIPRLRGPEQYAGYLRMATERSLERCGIDQLRPAPAAQPRPDRLHERGGLGRDGRRSATLAWRA